MRKNLPDLPLWKRRHAVGFEDNFINIDVHRTIFPSHISNVKESGYLDRLTVMNGVDYKGYCLHPSDMLVHTIEHGIRSGSYSKLVWIIDAVTIVKSGLVNWNIIIGYKSDLVLSCFLKVGLKYLNDNNFIEIPEFISSAFDDYQLTTNDLSLLKGYSSNSKVSRTWATYSSAHPHFGSLTKITRFPRYLSDLMGLKSPTLIPLDYVLRKREIGS
jgi:hypothetical protein